MLSNGDDDGLMVGGRVDGANTVSTSGDTSSNGSSDGAVNSTTVNTLEEGEFIRICWGSLLQRCDRLDHDMSVSNNLSGIVHSLWRSKVVLLCVYKVTSVQVIEVKRDGELGVCLDSSTVLWKGEFSTGHVVDRGDNSNGCRVARTCGDLLAVGKREVGNEETKVDKVIRGCQRGDLSWVWDVLTVILETRGDDTRIECQRSLRIVRVVSTSVTRAAARTRSG